MIRKNILSSEEHRTMVDAMAPMADVYEEVESIKFIPVDEYTTVRAEYGVKDEKNLAFHFFATPEANELPDPWKYWLDTFPENLERIALEHFRTEPPYLRAAYTKELVSWWLQCDGAAERTMDVDAYAKEFLDKLDAALDKAIGGSGVRAHGK